MFNAGRRIMSWHRRTVLVRHGAAYTYVCISHERVSSADLSSDDRLQSSAICVFVLSFVLCFSLRFYIVWPIKAIKKHHIKKL